MDSVLKASFSIEKKTFNTVREIPWVKGFTLFRSVLSIVLFFQHVRNNDVSQESSVVVLYRGPRSLR